MAYDPVTWNVYWISDRRILYTPLMNREKPKIFIDQGKLHTIKFSIFCILKYKTFSILGLRFPENIAVDWQGRNLYITDYGRNHILACNLQNSYCVSVLKDLETPRAIQLDLKHKKVA